MLLISCEIEHSVHGYGEMTHDGLFRAQTTGMNLATNLS